MNLKGTGGKTELCIKNAARRAAAPHSMWKRNVKHIKPIII